jgi:MarR family transcriptional regulator, organic hydroperoxide resistance regulator
MALHPFEAAPSRLHAMAASCDDNPLALLMGLADRLRLHFEAAATSLGLTPAQAQLLARLDGEVRMGDLASQSTCDPSSVTTMVKRLERDGLVQRIVDPNDARARLVRLTSKGSRLRNRFLHLVGDGASVLDALPDEHRAALARLFASRLAAAER